ncbi:MAG: hypothetical protein KJN73_01230, partial [Acidimicrobiia bacterium]|nr:hypothetical protein [Acidimicrobiia bacterium]
MRPSSAASQASPLRFGAPLAAAAVLGVLAGYPLWRLAAEALSGGGMGDALSATGVRTAAFNSLWTSAAAATLAAAAGTAVALLTERYRIRGATALRVAMVGTLIVPPFVSAVSWQATYAPFGLLDDLTGLSGGWIDGRVGVVVVIAVNVAPLAFLVVAAALRGSRLGDVERAARAAGAADAATLRSITLPLIRP